MITARNRKEVFVGYSAQEFNEIHNILKSHNIRHRSRIVSSDGASICCLRRSGKGRNGKKTGIKYEYYIYVHKTDYDKTSFILDCVLN